MAAAIDLPALGAFLREEGAARPGRARDALRIALAAVATVAACQALRVPTPDFAAYLVFFVANRNGALSLKLGLLAVAAATAALAVAIGVTICFGDAPWFRVPLTLLLIGTAVWLSRVLVLDVVGRLFAVVWALYLSLADTIGDAQILTTSILWLWSVVALPVGITIAASLLLPGRPVPGPARPPGLLVPDAPANPEYFRFAVRAGLAVAACEVFMQAVAWTGIRTCMVTVVVTALATREARLHKQALRLAGAGIGGALGLAAVLFLVPRMESLASLLPLVGLATFAFAWVAVGGSRVSYAGFQMALAFYILLLPGFDTSIDLTQIRDRFVGIVVGILGVWLFVDLGEGVWGRRAP